MTEPESAEQAPAPPEKEKKSSRWRLIALAVFFFGSLALAKVTGLSDSINVESIREFMESAGPLGFLGFLAIFALGELMHIPGFVFVGAASVAYGAALGSGAAYLGALASVCTSFVVVRTIGGQPLGDVQRPIVKRMLARLDDRPLRTITGLRLVFWMAPALNYALAMSRVKFRDYLAGSALGLLLPIPLVVIFFDWLVDIDLSAWSTELFTSLFS
ncbi:MAG TPA: TVP38/TMEM64 family protein [Polyangiaceae bacterium]|nr:TVP38/TMEM64 family protein [Polyangiaceae bacterium]